MTLLRGSLSSNSILVNNFASLPAPGQLGRRAILLNGGVCEWYDDGTAWQPYVKGIVLQRPPLANTFTGTNQQSGTTLTDYNGILRFFKSNNGQATVFGKTPSGTSPFSVETGGWYVNHMANVDGSNSPVGRFYFFGVFMRFGSTYRFMSSFFERTNYNNVLWFSNTTNLNASWGGLDGFSVTSYPNILVRLRYVNPTLTGAYSINGTDWYDFSSVNAGGTPPDECGLFAGTWDISGTANGRMVIYVNHYKEASV